MESFTLIPIGRGKKLIHDPILINNTNPTPDSLQGFATSGSIVLNGIVSATVNSSSGLASGHLSAQFVGGAAIVVVSTMIYHAAPSAPPQVQNPKRGDAERGNSRSGAMIM